MTSDQERQLLLVVVYLMDNHVVTSLFNWSDDLSVSDAENIMAIWRSERRNSAATRSSRDLPVNGNRSSVNVMWRGKALVPSGRLLVWIATETEIVYCYSDSVLCCLPLYHIGDLVYRAADGSLQITFVTYKSYQNGPHDLLSDVIIKDRGSGNASEVIQNEIMLLRFGTESEFQEFSMR
jgi:hypothetical protein